MTSLGQSPSTRQSPPCVPSFSNSPASIPHECVLTQAPAWSSGDIHEQVRVKPVADDFLRARRAVPVRSITCIVAIPGALGNAMALRGELFILSQILSKSKGVPVPMHREDRSTGDRLLVLNPPAGAIRLITAHLDQHTLLSMFELLLRFFLEQVARLWRTHALLVLPPAPGPGFEDPNRVPVPYQDVLARDQKLVTLRLKKRVWIKKKIAI